MKCVIIIPARYKSSRYPGKPLAKILGKEMILRVLEICCKVLNRKKVFVATENKKIKNLVKNNDFKAIMTSSKCLTGTDRVAEANVKIKSNIVLNVQGDEPTINLGDIKKILKAKMKFPKHVICGYTSIIKKNDENNINLPKVVLNQKSELIYISRAPIPGKKKNSTKINYLKQVCIYAFNQYQLEKFKKFGKKSNLEKLEDIEILRFFELGIPIKMVRLSTSSIAVDVKSDIKKVEKYLLNGKRVYRS